MTPTASSPFPRSLCVMLAISGVIAVVLDDGSPVKQLTDGLWAGGWVCLALAAFLPPHRERLSGLCWIGWLVLTAGSVMARVILR